MRVKSNIKAGPAGLLGGGYDGDLEYKVGPIIFVKNLDGL